MQTSAVVQRFGRKHRFDDEQDHRNSGGKVQHFKTKQNKPKRRDKRQEYSGE